MFNKYSNNDDNEKKKELWNVSLGQTRLVDLPSGATLPPLCLMKVAPLPPPLPPPLTLPLPPLGALHLTIPHTLLPNPRCHLDSGLGCHSCAPSTECNATTLPPALQPLQVHYTTQYHTCCLTQAATPCHPCHRSALPVPLLS